MTDANKNKLLDSLSERAKELNCLYRIDELLNEYKRPLNEIFDSLVEIIPEGWQYPEMTSALINIRGTMHRTLNSVESERRIRANIRVQNENIGYIEVYFHGDEANKPSFLPEEEKLLSTIAQWVSHYLYYRDLNLHSHKLNEKKPVHHEWMAIVEMIRNTDSESYLRLSRKMMNYLCWLGIPEARHILQSFAEDNALSNDNSEENKPGKQNFALMKMAGERIFELAEESISDDEILSQIIRWFQQDKIMFLLEKLENLSTSMSELHDSLTKFSHLDHIDLSEHTSLNLRVLLIYRFFTEQPEFINIAKNFVNPDDFYDLVQHIIYPSSGQGKLGGKAAGIFLATSILKGCDLKFKTPKTWYITSNALLTFLNYNNLREVIEQKYKNGEQIREEYPNIIHIFKNSYFPPEIIKGLQQALNDFGDTPLIVRSSSLLEDRIGATFSGKYKSLFIANQGTPQEKLTALMDAITEVYASTFGPDPIEYRRERNLLDFHEEMAVLIQEVVGVKAGKYFFPAFAGVAFSYNEFRWSPRLERDNGLLRLVPGLGTRAVDRIGDEYPLLLAPGQPSLRVNSNPDDILRYSPHRIDVIDLEKNSFVTHDLETIIAEVKDEYPLVEDIFSVYNDGIICEKSKLTIDFEKDNLLFTMNKYISSSPFLSDMRLLTNTLREKIGIGVDVEFAHDGKNLYILQCRGQGMSSENAPALIPQDINTQNIIFNAKQYISNGSVPEILHIVYVDPIAYKKIDDMDDLVRVGRA
ncbi:MAG TPA: PEP/pyruvate-binding domain-containing protein, partial [Candidatus Cloacimonadota bacterium]|nr:PEP/pyruvate-binding domain-containing protein [Candidatus Cloacimonadota bacterium]